MIHYIKNKNAKIPYVHILYYIKNKNFKTNKNRIEQCIIILKLIYPITKIQNSISLNNHIQ